MSFTNTIHRLIHSSVQKNDPYIATNLVRAGRIELPSRPWQGRVLPLNHARITYINLQ